MCIFCKIIAGEITSDIIAENDKALAILDIKPVRAGHILVMPKKHFASLEEIELDSLLAVASLLKEMGLLIKEKLQADSYNVILNNDKAAGQEIPHLHFHLIPRISGDELKLWSGKEYVEGEIEKVLAKYQA